MPILRFTGVDLSAALGKLVTFNAGVPAVNASATVPAAGIVLDGNPAAKESSIGLLGGNLPPVRALISGAQLYPGDLVQQAADGSVSKDLGTGNARCTCGFLSDPNGAVAGDFAEVTFFTPQIRT